MKRFILFFTLSMLSIGWINIYAQYNQHDLDKVLAFMRQKAINKELGHNDQYTNAMVLLGNDYTDDWEEKYQDWIEDIGLTWDTYLTQINWGSSIAPFHGYYVLSGNLDFSNCENIQSVNCPDHGLTSVNLSNCRQLLTVNLVNNLLTSADFSGSTYLTGTLLHLEENLLLFSTTILPGSTFNLNLAETIPYIAYVESETVTVDLSSEYSYVGGNYDWYIDAPTGGHIPIDYLSSDNGIFTFNATNVLGEHLVCETKSTNYPAFTIIFEISTQPQIIETRVIEQDNPINEAEVVIYKVEDNNITPIDTAFFNDMYVSEGLPKGTYIVSVNADGYLFSYYSSETTRTENWEIATPIKLTPIMEKYPISVFPIEEPELTNEGVSIKGKLQETEPNVVILLYKKDGEKKTLVRSVKTGENNDYQFDRLPKGTYLVAAEYAGFEREMITVNAPEPGVYGNYNFTINKEDKKITAAKAILEFSVNGVVQEATIIIHQKISDTEFIPVDTAVLQMGNGKYYTHALSEGEYIVSAEVPNCLHTYYSETGYADRWNKAKIIHVTAGLELTPLSFNFTSYQYIDNDATISGTLKGNISNVKNATILLYDSPAGQPLRTVRANATGNYSFGEGSDRMYYISVDIPGYAWETIEVYTAATSREFKHNNFSIDESEKVIKVDQTLSGRMIINVTPETVKDALVVIYQKESGNEYIAVDTARYDGLYYSEYLPLGNYIVRVEAAGYLPTYYSKTGSFEKWEDAETILIEGTDHEITIELEPEQILGAGDVTISGHVYDDDSKLKARVSLNATVGIYKSTSPSKASLKAGGYILIKTVNVDANGYFEFTGLPEDTYYIKVDIPGYEMTDFKKVDATASGNIYEDNNFYVDKPTKTIKYDAVMSTPKTSESALTIYPNPVVDVVRITGLEGNYTVKVINMLGQIIMTGADSTPELTLNLSGKPSGIYFLRIETQGKTITRKIMKK